MACVIPFICMVFYLVAQSSSKYRNPIDLPMESGVSRRVKNQGTRYQRNISFIGEFVLPAPAPHLDL